MATTTIKDGYQGGSDNQLKVLSDGSINVNASVSPSGLQDVNLTKVGGASISLGQQLAAASLPVVLTAAQLSTLTPLSTVNIGNFPATQAVTQSGSWTTGRTWTLASGTDSVASAQSGTWNINNISGTVSLPTGAATAANQTNVQSAPGVSASTAITIQGSASGVAIPVSGSFTPSGTQDVNLTKVGGTAFSLGQQLAASSLPVVLTAAQLSTLTPLSTVAVTQSGTWNVGLNAGSNTIGSINNISGTVSLPTNASTASNQSSIISNLQTINSLTPTQYDYISLGYTGSDLTSVVYKSGGSSGTIVSTLTLAYSGGVLQSVTKT